MAAIKALALPEIIEATLLNLSNAQILRARQVCHTWQNTIFESPALKEKLFLRFKDDNDPDDHDVYINPLFRSTTSHTVSINARTVASSHALYWAEPFDTPLPTPRCTLGIEMGPDTCESLFSLAAKSREDVLAVRSRIPELAKKMHLSKPTKLNKTCWISVSYEIDAKYISGVLPKILRWKIGAVVRIMVEVRVGTLGEYLEVCEALMEHQPVLESVVKVTRPRDFPIQVAEKKFTEEEMEVWPEEMRGRLVGKMPQYVFIVAEKKRRRFKEVMKKMWSKIF